MGAALLVVAVIVGIVLGFVKFGARGRIILAAFLLALAALGAWELPRDKSETIWVNDSADEHNTVMFAVPSASGVAQGNSYVFNSQASADEVFAALEDAYPQAQRDGDFAVFVVDGHDYLLTYNPDDPAFDWTLRNDQSQGPDEIFADAYSGGSRPPGRTDDEWIGQASNAVFVAGGDHEIFIASVAVEEGTDMLIVEIVGAPKDLALKARVERELVPVALQWAESVEIRVSLTFGTVLASAAPSDSV